MRGDFDGVGGFAGGGCGREAGGCVGGDVGVWSWGKGWGGVGSTMGFGLGIWALRDGFVGLVILAPFSGGFVGGCYAIVHMRVHGLYFLHNHGAGSF